MFILYYHAKATVDRPRLGQGDKSTHSRRMNFRIEWIQSERRQSEPPGVEDTGMTETQESE